MSEATKCLSLRSRIGVTKSSPTLQVQPRPLQRSGRLGHRLRFSNQRVSPTGKLCPLAHSLTSPNRGISSMIASVAMLFAQIATLLASTKVGGPPDLVRWNRWIESQVGRAPGCLLASDGGGWRSRSLVRAGHLDGFFAGPREVHRECGVGAQDLLATPRRVGAPGGSNTQRPSADHKGRCLSPCLRLPRSVGS